jgi:hypothetical protein
LTWDNVASNEFPGFSRLQSSVAFHLQLFLATKLSATFLRFSTVMANRRFLIAK